MDKFLLMPDTFQIRALHNMAIPTGMDLDLKAALQEGIKADRVTGTKLTSMLTSGPRHITKALQEWNYEDGLLLYKGLVYIPNNKNLKHKVTQLFHDQVMGHLGQWKTIELITQEYWWPRITEFVKAYIKGCAVCQTTKIRPPVKVPLKPNKIPQGIWDTITMDFITDLLTSKGYNSILTIVDQHSKAIILSPCNKNITAVKTSQLLLDNIWKHTGFPSAIISDWGPQFAAQVTQELWRKLGIKQKLSTAFHLQTDRESKQVNQEIEQYLHICGNFQQNDWATLLPLIEFAHNAQPHCSTHRSPFEIWYGFHPTFKPLLQLQTRLQSVDECIKYLEQIRKEVTAALHIAAWEMRSGGPPALSHTFHKDDLVLLEATNLQTTHPKAKLAPQCYGPFKVLWASPTNCKLALPPQMRIHPVFHNSLLKPYIETSAHGPNFTWPPPEIVGGEEGHYKIEKILQSRPTRNKRSTEYLVHWKGYTDTDCTWVPAKELTHAKELVQEFLSRQKPKEGIWVLQVQQKPKEGILSRTESVTSCIQRIPSPSPSKPAPKLKYSYVVESTLRPCDPGKPSHDLSHVQSHDISTTLRSCDI